MLSSSPRQDHGTLRREHDACTNLLGEEMDATRRKREAGERFRIYEDAPRTEDTEMMAESEQRTEEEQPENAETEAEGGDEDDARSFSSDEGDAVDSGVQKEMDKLQDSFPGFQGKYRLIKRIGEGTFSTVYKAEDVLYDRYENGWDLAEKEKENHWSTAPLRRYYDDLPEGEKRHRDMSRRKARYVAVKKIYVTSSPSRILNEIELLHDLKYCHSISPLITAFRHTDQVVVVLPYFRHEDFRDYFRNMTVPDVVIYLRSLFSALEAVHEHKILHRDIKPTNFLYDPSSRRGVLVDFGLAEREGADSKPCLCHETRDVRKSRVTNSVGAQNGPQSGYPKNDTRSSRRANRAGTRGFRAPEVLFKCTEQTTKIDIWSAGVILLTILSKRFPFFNSADDVEAMIEIATIFGIRRMRQAGLLHGCIFDTSIPTIGSAGFTLEKIILWSTCRTADDREEDGAGKPLDENEKLAVEFLGRCLELDPAKRISAKEALDHEFLREPGGGERGLNSAENGAEDEMDLVE